MASYRITWANHARLTAGQRLVEVDGELVTRFGRFIKNKYQLRTASGALSISATGDITLLTLATATATATNLESEFSDAADILSSGLINDNSSKGPFPFLDLNWDCRQAVLKVIIGHQTVAVFLPGRFGQNEVGIRLLEIMKTNKQVRLEPVLVAIKQTAFCIHSGPGNTKFQAWLGGIDFSPLKAAGDVSDKITTGFDAVRELRFPYFSRFPHHLPHITSNNDVDLMEKCGGLRKISIDFKIQEVYHRDNSGEEKPAEQLVKEYYMSGILGLKNLEVLRFTGHCNGNVHLGVAALGKWFEDKFAEHESGERKRLAQAAGGCCLAGQAKEGVEEIQLS